MPTSYNVLIVDDSKSLRMVIRKLVESSDYLIAEIFEAGNGQEALDILRGNKVDVVFSDINMPVMNGLEFIKAMRSGNISVPTIVISTEANQETVIEAVKNGAKGYIRKPFSADKVREVMEKAFK